MLLFNSKKTKITEWRITYGDFLLTFRFDLNFIYYLNF